MAFARQVLCSRVHSGGGYKAGLFQAFFTGLGLGKQPHMGRKPGVKIPLLLILTLDLCLLRQSGLKMGPGTTNKLTQRPTS